MKEQQNEKMKQTLNSGLFNGLKFSVLNGDAFFSHLHVDYPELAGIINDRVILNNGYKDHPIEFVTPHLFPLSYLTKEITVEGYNGNKPFCFIDQWEVGDDGDVWAGIEFDHGNNRLIKDLESIAEHNIYHDIQYLPSVVVDLMRKLHFNTEGVKEFIDASKSKVYEPKK